MGFVDKMFEWLPDKEGIKTDTKAKSWSVQDLFEWLPDKEGIKTTPLVSPVLIVSFEWLPDKEGIKTHKKSLLV